MNFQDAIATLHKFWGDQGCLIAQPYDTEKGAGTKNPHTFLRALGPEPWAVAYVEPCRRPSDGRYGENPNRYQHYYQYQVLIKPSPDTIQDMYLDSLRALTINPDDHDIRFVEDNWEDASVGAWGVGWEVWLDGMEVTQFTYFQQCGGLDCNPVAIEITYGLERLAMYLQGVDAMADIQWNDTLTYGDVHLQGEIEQCAYNFEASNPIREGSHQPGGKGVGAAGFGLCAEVFPYVQYVGRAGLYLGDGADSIYRPNSWSGEKGGATVCAQA